MRNEDVSALEVAVQVSQGVDVGHAAGDVDCQAGFQRPCQNHWRPSQIVRKLTRFTVPRPALRVAETTVHMRCTAIAVPLPLLPQDPLQRAHWHKLFHEKWLAIRLQPSAEKAYNVGVPGPLHELDFSLSWGGKQLRMRMIRN